MNEESELSGFEPAPLGGAEHFGPAWDQLLGYASLLEREGERQGLIGPREGQRLWTRHILNSTAILEYVSENARVIDVGSGAGFPGIVLAVLRPDTRVTLVESMERRCTWLSLVARELQLANVKVAHARSEELHGKMVADVVTARAVAALNKLLPMTMPLVKRGGSLVALKGARIDEEIAASDRELRRARAQWVDVHLVTPFGCDEATRVVEVRKQA